MRPVISVMPEHRTTSVPLFIYFCLSVIAYLATSVFTAHAQTFNMNQFGSNQNSFLPVEQAFEFSYQQTDNELVLRFNIAEDYYLYQHRFSYQPESLIYTIHPLPKADPHYDEFFGETFIYRDQLEIVLELGAIRSGDTLTFMYQGCADAGLCYAPTRHDIELQPTVEGTSSSSAAQGLEDFSDAPGGPFSQVLASDNLVWIMLIFLLLGLGLAFTPCVFPMYPIIAGIIGGQINGGQVSSGQKGSNPKSQLTALRGFILAMIYVQGMALTYTALGIVVALAGMQYQAFLQHPVILITLALLFIVLAAGMFGAYTLQLPASWQTRLNTLSQRQRGGAYGGVFLMGIISGLVASPCTTAPLSGVLLFIAQSGDVLSGALILYALSMGMGIPLLLIGASGGKLLPKAGPWMNSVKLVFGFLLLAVALFMLERMLPMLLAALLWIAFAFIALIVIGRSFWPGLKSRGRHILLVFSIAFAILTLAWQAPFIRAALGAQHEFEQVHSLSELQGKLQQTSGQWTMLDLYADWCVACKELEVYTFANPYVQTLLEDLQTLQADVTTTNATNTELLSHYQVVGLPTILFFDPDGNEVSRHRITGFMNAADFAEHLKSLNNE